MSVTVAQLLQMPHLRLRLHSGMNGTDRTVAWTHTSDLPDPWRWLTGGELLLTNGMCFPAGSRRQAELIGKLVEAGAAGLAIGEQMYCPPLTEALSAASDALSFPVLWVEYPMPFVAISRAVAEATLIEQSQRLIRTERIYLALQVITGALPDRSLLAEALGRELACRVLVCHREGARQWYPNDQPLGPAVAEVVRSSHAASARVRAGAFVHPLPDGRALRMIGVPTHADAVMAVVSEGHDTPDAILMQHAATVLALEMSQALMHLEHARRVGEELFTRLLAGQLDPNIGNELDATGLAPARTVLASVAAPDEHRIRRLHVALWRQRVPHLILHRPALAQLLIPDDAATLATLVDTVGRDAHLGISARLDSVARVPDAAREALWALRMADRDDTPTVRYGQATRWLGMSDVQQAQALVDRTLRPLLDYQHTHGGELLATLRAFFGQRRSWQRTAEALHVHRQTVLYRIRKVEAITGRDLDDTADLAELWLGLQALDLLAGPG